MTKIPNANELLKYHYSSTDSYYRYMLGMLITDGAKALADEYEAYWFIDVVCSYQLQLKRHEFQVWVLTVNPDDSACVVCTDGNNKVLRKQVIPYTDFKALKATLWVEGEVVLLPSEH